MSYLFSCFWTVTLHMIAHCTLTWLFMVKLKKSPFFTPLFDESLIDILNKDQMDIHILFYDIDSAAISTKYLDFCFVFCPNVNTLSGEIINSVKDLDASKMIMLDMDGPNVNWCVFDKIIVEREKRNHAPLFNVGSCGLHSIHGAFETGMISNQ